MDAINLSSFTSPKRKRFPPAVSTIPPTPPTSSPPRDLQPDLNIPLIAVNDEGEAPGSPRSKVAHNFQGLQIQERPEVLQFRLSMSPSRKHQPHDAVQDDDPDPPVGVVRKRMKMLKKRRDIKIEIPETPDIRRQPVRETEMEDMGVVTTAPTDTEADAPAAESLDDATQTNLVDPVVFKGNHFAKNKSLGDLRRAYPSINRLSDSKSRSKKRFSTPPLSNSTPPPSSESDPPRIIDPERAALTWHDDEITGHIPDDPDDDGEGINGIGFKPTSAEAYSRSQKRRQQMEEYKNREAREARRERIEKRRGGEREKEREREREMVSKEAEKERRVRFLEGGGESVVLS